MPLSKDEIRARFKARPLAKEEVSIPELEGSVWVRVMTGTERDKFEARQRVVQLADFRARFAQATVCNEDGSLMFSEAEIPEIGAWPSTALDAIFEVAKRLNGLTADDVKELSKKSAKTDGSVTPSVFLDGTPRPVTNS